MDNTMKNATTEEFEGQETFFENDAQEEETTVEEAVESSDDPLKEAIEDQLKKIRRQNMLIGFQTACRVALEKIIVAERKPGKRTMNDYKRLIKDLKQFCETGLSRTVNTDGETEPVKEESSTEETVQN
jgi:hypothetical protein